MTAPRKSKSTTAKDSAISAARSSRNPSKRKPPEPPVQAGPLTPEQISHFHELLLASRRELVGDVDQMRGEALNNNRQESAGELSSMPIHMADVGTDNYEQEFTLGLIESERQMLRDIDRALNKIENGGYGICEGTGAYIDHARLEARPEARYSIEYARKIEQGLIKPPSADEVIRDLGQQGDQQTNEVGDDG